MAGAKSNRLTRTKNKNQDQKTGKTSKTGKADFQGFLGQLPFLIVKKFAMAEQFALPAMSVIR